MHEQSGNQGELSRESPLLTRVDLPKSPEAAKRFDAIHTLVELGLLIPVDKLTVYHGRVAKADEDPWEVNPVFSNADNDTGHRNFSKRSTLYASPRYEDAQAFAHKRAEEIVNEEVMQSLPEQQDALRQQVKTRLRLVEQVNQLTSPDPESTVINFYFEASTLSEDDRNRLMAALAQLSLEVTEGAPVEFNNREEAGPFLTALKEEYADRKIEYDEALALAAKLNIDGTLALSLAGSHNSRLALGSANPGGIINVLFEKNSPLWTHVKFTNGKEQKIPYSLEHVETFLRHSHIVGAQLDVLSATLKKQIPVIAFFDLEKVATPSQISKESQETTQKFGGLHDKLPALPGVDPQDSPEISGLLTALQDNYIQPNELVAAAKRIAEFKSIFEKDAGNWEKFTLEQHVETVLRNFDENVADTIPAEYLPVMRLAILVHDIGKPIAAERGVKEKQQQFNATYADQFLRGIGASPELRVLVISIITKGSSLAFELRKKPNDSLLASKWHNLAVRTLQLCLHRPDITPQEIETYQELCRTLLLCDGGSYTTMAVTRKDTVYYRNAPSFNASFETPRRLGKRDIRMAKTTP